MVKCAKCNKLVNKKNPGLQCIKCNKWIHGPCGNLTTEQLSTLFSTESADWKCQNCVGSAKPKRLSFIMPDPEEDDNTDSEIAPIDPTVNSMTKQMLVEIKREIRQMMREELQSILQFYSDKIDDYEIKMKALDNQCIQLNNIYKNLSLKNNVLEQKINSLEQQQLKNIIEIHGIKEQEKEDVTSLSQSVCIKLNLEPTDVKSAYRKKTSRSRTDVNKPTPIVVSLCDGKREKWLAAAKNNNITSKDIGTGGDNKVFVRESLTPTNAFLLWKAKTTLTLDNLCKYVWCKNGTILARKSEKEKAHIIRTEDDINRLASEFKKLL